MLRKDDEVQLISESPFPPLLNLPTLKLIQELMYGVNPDQKAALYAFEGTSSPLAMLTRLSGRETSATNITDIDKGLQYILTFEQPAAVVIKHNIPSGIAISDSLTQALKRAIEAESKSAFGGVIVCNREIDSTTARVFREFKERYGVLIDVIATPNITPDALAIITKLRKTTAVYSTANHLSPTNNSLEYKLVEGGLIVQERQNTTENKFENWKVVTVVQPTINEVEQMKFGWKIIGNIPSNAAIVLDKDTPMTRGIGSGQTNRVDAVEIALKRAGRYAKNGVLINDGFFFPDTVELAAQYGVTAILQPGGSIKDQEVIKKANEYGISMVFTGQRKFSSWMK